MPLPPRNPGLMVLAREANRRAYRCLAGTMDDDQCEQAEAEGGQIVRQQAELDAAYAPGFFCRPPADAEQVVVFCEGGSVIVGWRCTPPAAVASRTAAHPALYDSSGNLITLDGSAGGQAKMAAGVFKVHNGGTTKSVVLDGDNVYGTTAFVDWLNAVAAKAGYAPPWAGAVKIADAASSCNLLEAE